jgi:SnoaL-like polyketide cyclase
VDEDFNKAVVRRFIEGFLNTGDVDIADEVLAADYIDHTSSNPEMCGHENIRQFVDEWLTAFPNSHSVVEDMVAEGALDGGEQPNPKILRVRLHGRRLPHRSILMQTAVRRSEGPKKKRPGV